MSYQAAKVTKITCDGIGCKASSLDYAPTKAMDEGKHQAVRSILTNCYGWVCALGLDLCPQHSDARYEHQHESVA